MIRIGIVGCGRILAAHLRGYKILRQAGVDDFRITALCARKEADAWMYVKRGEGPPQRPPVSDMPGDPLAIGDQYLSDFQDDTPVEVYTDYRKMIASGPIDAVNDFTIHSLHHRIATEAFHHDKDLLTQKPLAVTIAAARQMCEQAQAAGRVLGVFENFRNNPITRHLTWLFESGRIGKLQMILLGNIGTWWAPNRIVAETPWRHQLIEGGGITLDLGVHFFDQMRLLAGEPKIVSGLTVVLEPARITLDKRGKEIQRISCDADDSVFANVEFESGVVANIATSWAGHGQATRMGAGLVYYGSAGRVTGPEVTLDDGSRLDISRMYEEGADRGRKTREFPLGITDGFALNQYDWLEAIRTRRQPETSGQEGLRDLAAAYSILESHVAGRRVEYEEVLNGQLREYQRPIDQHFGLE